MLHFLIDFFSDIFAFTFTRNMPGKNKLSADPQDKKRITNMVYAFLIIIILLIVLAIVLFLIID
jgi:hypothetical protein